jgi:hypothetical protein
MSIRTKTFLIITALIGVVIVSTNYWIIHLSNRTTTTTTTTTTSSSSSGSKTSFSVSSMLSIHRATNYISETAESSFRDSRFHSDIQNLSKSTLVVLPENNVTYVYIHVPRTGGDSMAVHLFPTSPEVMYSSTRVAWWGDVGVPDLWTELKEDENFTGPNNYKRLYKAFWSRDRLTAVVARASKNRDGTSFDTSSKQVQMFTILRHPHERLVSTYKHLKKWGDTVCSGTLHEYLIQLSNNVTDIESQCISGKSEYVTKHKTFSRNGMMYQLGNVLEYDKRDVSPEIALERAKAFIDQMKFVGFYEDWNVDYRRLEKEVFSELVETQTWLQWFRSEIFMVGTWVARNRMRTLKYSGHVKGVDRTMLEEYTKWDMELYAYARGKMGRDANGGLYTSYNEWIACEILPAVLCAAVFCTVWHWMCRRKKKMVREVVLEEKEQKKKKKKKKKEEMETTHVV